MKAKSEERRAGNRGTELRTKSEELRTTWEGERGTSEKQKMKKEKKMENGKFYKYSDSGNANMLPGNPKGLPDESFFPGDENEETLVFIDEAFLSKLSKYFGEGKYLKFDRVLFSRNVAKKEKLILKNIFFYIAPPFQCPVPSKDEELRKEGYDRLVNQLREREVIVREGMCQRLKINGKFKYNQKAVDVLLAMDLTLTPLKYPKIKKIILIACDSDFVPVIHSLREFGVKTVLYTYYEKKRNTNFSRSNDLIKSVHKYVLLSGQDFLGVPLNRVKTGGTELRMGDRGARDERSEV